MTANLTESGLQVQGLVSGYRRGPDVIRDVTFHAGRGEITALVGPNGSGKTTLLHTLLGLLPRRSGQALLNGISLDTQVASMVGFCADDLPMPHLLTGLEYVESMAGLRSLPVDRAKTLEYFVALRMETAVHSLIGNYSHGMKRKVQLIANILHQPSLLVLDEPFRGLDPETAALLRRVLQETARRGRIILVSTHDLGAVSSFCDRVVVISDGRLVLNSSIQLLKDGAEGSATFLEDVFLDVTGLRDDVESSAARTARLMGEPV